MRKILAFLVLLMLPWTARGQALADWYYWFDYDSSPHESGKVIGQQFQIQPDVSHLATGVHTLYVQVVDSAGVYSTPVGTMFFKVPDATTIDKLFYTIDTEETPTVLDFDDGSFTLDVSKYQPGFHRITLQVMDKQNGVSDVMPYMFYKVPQNNNLAEFRYWFDSDATVRTMPYGQGQYILDVSHLIPGFHFINYYVADGEENMTKINNAGFFRLPVASNQKLHYWFAGDTVATQVPDFQDGFIVDVTRLQEGFNTIYFQLEDNGPTDIMIEHFIKIPQTENGGDMTLVCIIDGKVVGEEKVSAHGGVVKCDMDVSNMEVGLYKAMFQLITPSGAGSSIAETYFIRTLTNEDVASMQCSYTIDGFKHHVHKGTSTNGVFHFDLPVDDVEDGLHRIDYMLVAENGASTTQGSAWFFKTPVGGNGITQYDYWLNDKSDEVQSVVLDEPKDPFQLIKLLPIPSEPIRSSCFHFEVKDEKPMMYAKNDIHFRFHDRTGRWVDESKQYVDYNTSAAITDASQLKSTQTFARPDENDIKWFKFEAAPGDTIGFKSSQATSLQVFAPSGKEILTTMGDKSVQYTGAHTWEDGTYYVAVHDVTGSKPNVTLDYMHMDKYDVVSQDVHVVGNGGCSTITFQGNGFRDLYAVDLKDSKGNIIESIDVGHESDATTTVTFDFTGAKLGKYNAVFHFTEDDKTVTNYITVEEAKDMQLDLSVTFPSTFLRGSSVEYIILVKNEGNSTAYDIPIELTLKSEKLTNTIKSIDVNYEGQNLNRLGIDGLDRDSIDAETLQKVDDYVNSLTGLETFMVVPDEEFGEIAVTHLLLTIPAFSSKEIRVTVNATSRIKVEALIPSDWITVNQKSEKMSTLAKARKASRTDGLCCYKEKIECTVSVICGLVGLVPVAGCVSGAVDLGTYTITEYGCSAGENLLEKLKNTKRNMSASSLGFKSLNAILSCFAGAIGEGIANLIKKKNALIPLRDAAKEAASIARQKQAEKLGSYSYLKKQGDEAFGKGDYDAANIYYESANQAKAEADAFEEAVRLKEVEYETYADMIFDIEKQIDNLRENLQKAFDAIKNAISNSSEIYNCYKEYKSPSRPCPENPKKKGGSSSPVNSYDPNDIYGFIAPSGSMYVGEDVVNMPYRIEFENDTTFATSAAHMVVVKDTLDAKAFDLSSYQPTSIKIGDKSVQLKGDKTFVTTFDMRPEINAIAQVEGLYDEKKGVATWTFTSLDPMTMEPTDDVMQGFLPVNYDGSGIGEVAYNINRKTGLSDGTAISNKASIVFDSNDAIETPVWTNIIDAVPPVTHVSEVEQVNDTIVRVHFDGDDNRSGLWKYALYVQYGEVSSWFQVAETDTTCFDFRFYEDIDYGFCVVATDMAGNVEKKVIQREYKFINGEGEMIDGISSPKADQVATNRAYDLSGRLIQEEGYRGVVIKNRKKIFKR